MSTFKEHLKLEKREQTLKFIKNLINFDWSSSKTLFMSIWIFLFLSIASLYLFLETPNEKDIMKCEIIHTIVEYDKNVYKHYIYYNDKNEVIIQECIDPKIFSIYTKIMKDGKKCYRVKDNGSIITGKEVILLIACILFFIFALVNFMRYVD